MSLINAELQKVLLQVNSQFNFIFLNEFRNCAEIAASLQFYRVSSEGLWLNALFVIGESQRKVASLVSTRPVISLFQFTFEVCNLAQFRSYYILFCKQRRHVQIVQSSDFVNFLYCISCRFVCISQNTTIKKLEG